MATKFKFTRAFDVTIRDKRRGAIQAVVAYPDGHEGLIPEDHATIAEEAGAGQRADRMSAGNADAMKSGSDNVSI
jgi:hypothetical protein